MRRILLLILLSTLTGSVAFAQQEGEGSVYSRFGLGQLLPHYASKSYALGGEGLAYNSVTFTNLANPASLSDQGLVRLSGGMRFEGVETTDALDVQSKLSSSSFDGLTLGIPLIPNKVGVALGFSKMSQVGYLIDVVKPLDLGDAFDSGENFGARFQGSGGLNRISTGVGYRLNRVLSLGLRTDVIFGLIEDVQETVFQDARYVDAKVVRSTRLVGATLGLGGRLSLRGLLRESDFLNLALTIDLPTTLDGTRVVAEGRGITADTLRSEVTGSTKIPLSVGVGVLYQPSAKISLNADLRFEPWSNFSSELNFPGYAVGGQANTNDRLRISGGIEYFPAGRDLLASVVARTAYRLGAFTESGYISPDAGKRVNSYGITSGVSLPTLNAGTRIDINLDVGTRGTATGSLVRDRYFRIGLNINFAERWFARRQLG
ncbi:MAG: hypothetical protein ACI9W4_000224 [Rhodothermales bacterium]|jgi:hypothetical protein